MSIITDLLSKYESESLSSEFSRIINILESNDIDYAIIGSMAYNTYVKKPRNTSDIDILVSENDKSKVTKLMKSNFPDNKVITDNDYQLSIRSKVNSKWSFDYLFSFDANPEYGAIQYSKKREVIDGVKASVATPKYLVWLYLQSDREQNHLDAKTLLDESNLVSGVKPIDVEDLREEIEESVLADKTIIPLLTKLMQRIRLDKEKYESSSDYSKSWSELQKSKQRR